MPTTTGKATDLITFSRGSLATVTDADGKIKWAPHNLLLASEQFDASNWSTASGVTTVANNAVAPNGTTTAEYYLATNAVNYRGQSGVTAIATQYTYSCFAKKGNTDWVYMNTSQIGTGDLGAWFDIQNGVKGNADAGVTNSIQSVGNGWYILSITWTAVAGNLISVLPRPRAGNGSTVTSVNDFVYLWGAHLYRSDLGGMQANASAYPLYNPSTPKNLLGFSELLTTGWTNTNTTDSQVSVAGPTTPANSIEVTATAGNGTLLSSLSLLASPYTFSIWLKRKTGTGTVEITVDGTTYVTAAVTSDWQRFSTTLTPSAGTKTPGIRLVTSGDAIYAWGAQLSDSASLDPYVGSYGPAPSAAAAHGPRLDFDPVTLAARGLLVEEQRTNISLHSNDFSQSAWTKINLTNVTTKTTGPDAVTDSGTLLNENTVNSEHGVSLTFSKSASATTYTLSCFAKVGVGRTRITMAGYSNTESGNGTFAPFDLSGGQTGSISNRGSGWAGSTSSITPVGNGWYRCTLTVTTSTGTDIVFQILNDSGSGTATQARAYAGTVGNGCYIYGAQLEAGSFPTSYIPTGAATATRTADVASVATSQFPYSASEGTIVVSGDFSGVGSVLPGFVALNDGAPDTPGSVSWAALYATTTVAYSARRSNSVDATTITAAATLSANTPIKLGTAFAVGGTDALSVNGGSVATQSGVASAYANNVLRIGRFGSNPGYLNGHIRQITYIPRRLTNAELQARTV